MLWTLGHQFDDITLDILDKTMNQLIRKIIHRSIDDVDDHYLQRCSSCDTVINSTVTSD